MANIDRELSVLTSQLQKSHVEDQGLSFSGRTLKLNTEKDGKYLILFLLSVDFYFIIIYFIDSSFQLKWLPMKLINAIT